MKRGFALLVCLASLACAQAAEDPRARFTQRLVVQFHDAPALAKVASARKEQAQLESVNSLGARRSVSLKRVRETAQGAVVVALPAAVTLDEARRTASLLADDDAVAHAEADVRVFVHQVAAPQAADPLFASQWNLPGPLDPGGSPGGINVTAVWPLTSGQGVTVAVIDTGYTSHADLDATWLPGHDFISADAGGTLETANDGDGRDVDAADPGDWCSVDGAEQPSSWHGTAVASVIAAQANGYGIVGAAPGVRILPVRAIGRCGGYMSDVIDAMRWAAGLPVAGAPANPHPAKVLNLSLGSTPDNACSILQQRTVDEIVAANVMIVAAAGNEGVAGMGVPANCSQVLAVAAHTRQGDRAGYSNFHAGVALTAPGGVGSSFTSAILAAGNSGTTSPGLPEAGRGFAGTSAATPHVAAAAALLWSQDLARPLAEIRNALTGAARQWPADSTCLSGSSAGRCGAGMLDAGAAMSRLGRQVAVAIAAPSGTQAGNAAITVTATARSGFAPSQLTWHWSQTSGAPAQLADVDAPTVRITLPPYRTTIGLRVTVTDPLGGQTIDDTIVNVNNEPVAQAVEPIVVRPGGEVVLRLVASDPDGDSIRYTLLQGPAGMTVGRDDGKVQWVADSPGDRLARIAIEDAHGLRGSDVEVRVQVTGEDDGLGAASPLGSAGSGSGGGGAFGWIELALVACALASLRTRPLVRVRAAPRHRREPPAV